MCSCLNTQHVYPSYKSFIEVIPLSCIPYITGDGNLIFKYIQKLYFKQMNSVTTTLNKFVDSVVEVHYEAVSRISICPASLSFRPLVWIDNTYSPVLNNCISLV